MKIAIVSLNFIFLLLACEKENMPKSNSDIKFVYGTVCGWCAGNDSLVITSEMAYYFFDSPCNNNDDFKKSTETDSLIWSSLTDKLNWSDFRAININSCNVCVDGCDTLLRIQIKDKSHLIRFGYGDSAAIKNVRSLVYALENTKQYYRSKLKSLH